MPGFALKGDVRIWLKKDIPSQGKYLFIWTAEGKWKEEIVFNGYKRVRSGDGKQFWQVRSSETENPPIIELDELMKIRHELKIEEGDKLKRLHSQKIESTEADCIRYVSNKGFTQTFCFNPDSGELLRYTPDKDSSEVPWKPPSHEYSQFQEWSGKSFPRTVRGFNGKRLVVEVQLDEIKPLPQLPPNYFHPPQNATVWCECTDGAVWKIKDRMQPVYPSSARMRGNQGTVSLYAVIEEDGHISNLRVLHSAGTELDQAAISAVSHWRYERTTNCVDSKGRTESSIDIIFWLER